MRNELPEESTTVAAILSRLGRRSFGGILILLAGLGLIPGISVVVGFIILVLGLQMMVGFESPSLPKAFTQRQIKSARAHQVLGRCIQYVVFIEKWVKPRWTFMNKPIFTMALGLVITGLGFVMLLPLPFSNFPPAVTIIILSIGQLERDGLTVFVGLVASVVSFTVGSVAAGVAIQSLYQLFT